MRLRRLSVAVAAVGLLAAPASSALAQQGQPRQGMQGKPGGPGQKGMNDRRFVMQAASRSRAEVQLGKMAIDKAQDNAVKQYAQRMVTDHSKLVEDLNRFAKQEGWTLPKEQPKRQAATIEHMQSLSGAEFDRAYMQHAVMDHQRDVELFQAESTQGQDTELKAWAARQVAVLESHLTMARDIAGKVGAGGKQGDGK